MRKENKREFSPGFFFLLVSFIYFIQNKNVAPREENQIARPRPCYSKTVTEPRVQTRPILSAGETMTGPLPYKSAVPEMR
jgi:hypothetical protein